MIIELPNIDMTRSLLFLWAWTTHPFDRMSTYSAPAKKILRAYFCVDFHFFWRYFVPMKTNQEDWRD
uniref:Uncharacterized protein n=1 Tax=Ascaris lumbricoides TaxID=6252 RepID=A0A0M3HVB9_ASCLU